jgi:hypothetical protein
MRNLTFRVRAGGIVVLTAIVCAASAVDATAQAAQPNPAGWTACGADDQPVVLGGRTIRWADVKEPRESEVPLGVRPTQRSTAAASDAARADTAAAQAEQVFCVHPGPAAMPAKDATHALLLVVAGKDEQTFTRVEIYLGTTLILASDSAAPQHTMLLPSRQLWQSSSTTESSERVFAVVSREDAGERPSGVTVMVHQEALSRDTKFADGQDWFVKSVSEGNAFLYMASPATYKALQQFAQCDWLAYDARHGSSPPSGAVTTPSDTGCFDAQMKALGEQIYPFVSALAGRSPEREFGKGQPRMSLNEPMLVFFGLGGWNKILQLDCRRNKIDGETGECTKFSEPWQTTLQRARYVWAVYIEDEQTPFNTSIDVEFKGGAPSVDYEEYDPRGLARPAAALMPASTPRFLRIGYRRVRVREAPISVQVAFSRQGPNYGLRQWVRVYRQFSGRWWVVSGAILLPLENNAVSHIELEPVLPPEGGPAVRSRIVEDLPIAPVYATLIWRWPQVRNLAENQPRAAMRLLVNLIPDVVGGMSLPPRRHNSYLAGGSWPILADRLSFIMGAKIYRDEQPTPGFAVGQSVPASTPIEAVRGTPEHHVGFTFGLAVELVRSR